jgi:hypothetical protein
LATLLGMSRYAGGWQTLQHLPEIFDLDLTAI